MLIPTEILKAAHLFISKEQTRYYLAGVNIEASEGAVRLTSTDGHRLFTASVAFEDPQPMFETFILPGDAIKRALTGYKEEMIEIDTVRETVGSVAYKPIDGTFPDWRRVAPDKITGEAAQLDPQYVADFGKAAKILRGHLVIRHNGGSPAVIGFGRLDCVGLLMPLRDKSAIETEARLLAAHFGQEPKIELVEAA